MFDLVQEGKKSSRILAALTLLLFHMVWPLPSFGQADSPVAEGHKTTQEAHAAPLNWEELAEGLELTSLDYTGQDKIQITILRIDPRLYDFSLHGPLWDADRAMSIEEWARQKNLLAVINAGMYLPDNLTPSAYARKDGEDHGLRLAARYGGFFVSSPLREGLPSAAILDRTTEDLELLLPAYANVAQNFRLLGPDSEQLWPIDGPTHAMAAIGQDSQGRILFMHCRSLVNVHSLVTALLASPDLALHSAIYVEGGSQASLCLNLPERRQTWTGRFTMDILLRGENGASRLPFVLGIKARGE